MYWLYARLREKAVAYKIEDKYYTSSEKKIEVNWDPLVLYEIHDGNNIYLEDGYSHKIYSLEEYDPCIYFIKNPILNNKEGYNHDVSKGMSLIETYEYSIKNPKDITTLVSGNGIIVELSYQK